MNELRSATRGDLGLKRQLNFRQIVLRVALENQARAFDVNFARRDGSSLLTVSRIL